MGLLSDIGACSVQYQAISTQKNIHSLVGQNGFIPKNKAQMVVAAPSSTKRQWYSIVKSCGFRWSDLIEKQGHCIFNME